MFYKKWVLSFFFTALSFFILTIGAIFILTNKFEQPFRFSNSISYDVKLLFLHNNNKLLNESNTIVIGSSMALNNIDSSELITNSKYNSVINVSSWGLQVPEVYQLLRLLDLSNKKYIIYSTQYIDFQYDIEKNIDDNEVKKYIYNQFSFYPYVSTLNSFILNINNMINYDEQYKDKNLYSYLVYDQNGDINFNFDNDRYINKNRWSDIEESTLNMKNFDTMIKLNHFLKTKNIELIVITTPLRKEIINNPVISHNFNIYTNTLESLSHKYNFKYLNTHNILDLDDSYFVDKSHLNYLGAKKVTQLIEKVF